MKCSTKEALVYPVVCGIVIFLSTISSTSAEGAIVPASTSLWASQMGHTMGGLGNNPNNPHHRFYRFSPFFYSNKNPYSNQQQVIPGFNMINSPSSNGLKTNAMQQPFKRMGGDIQAYLGQPTELHSPTAKTATGQVQPYSRLIQGPSGMKAAGLGKQPYETLAQTISSAQQQPFKRLSKPVTKAANPAQPFKRLAIPAAPVKKPSSSFQLRIPALPTPQTGTPSGTPTQPYKRLPGRGLNIKKLNNNPSYASIDKGDSDVIVVKSPDLVSQDQRRKVYEQDVEVNSKLYKGFRVFPAVPLDHNEY